MIKPKALILRSILLFLFFSSNNSNAVSVTGSNSIDLNELLRVTASELGVALSLTGTSSVMVPTPINLNAKKLLTQLAHMYEFDWFIFGGALRVIYQPTLATASYRPTNISSNQLINLVLDGIEYKNTNSVKIITASGSLLFSGSQEFVTYLYELATSIDLHTGITSNSDFVVKSFNLKHLSVIDRRIVVTSFGGQEEIIVPGAVSVIQGLIGDIYQISYDGDPNEQQNQTMPGSSASVAKNSQKNSVEGKVNFTSNLMQRRLDVIIENNTIVVRDTPENIMIITDIIDMIDVSAKVLAFEVSVIDVRESDARKFNSLFGSSGFGVNNSTGNIFLGPKPFLPSANFQIGVQALVESQVAEVAYSTTIVSLENRQGIFGTKSTVYVPLEGRNEVGVEPVTADNTLYISGRQIEDEIVKVNVFYREETLTDQNETNPEIAKVTPRVSGSSLVSETHINASETFVVGGFRREESNEIKRKIPFLGDIPLFGALFRSSEVITESFYRYVAISAVPIG